MTRPLPKVSEPALRKKARSFPSIAPRFAWGTPAATSGTPTMRDVVDILRPRTKDP